MLHSIFKLYYLLIVCCVKPSDSLLPSFHLIPSLRAAIILHAAGIVLDCIDWPGGGGEGTRPTHAMVLRLHEGDLAELAKYTRAYLAENIENMAVNPYAQSVDEINTLAGSSLKLDNISIVNFSPPRINYRPSAEHLLYIDTDGGGADLLADWALNSRFFDALGLPLTGHVHGQITGFASDIAIETSQEFAPINYSTRVDQSTQQRSQHTPQRADSTRSQTLGMHQCIARFERFDLQLSGSLAADILHWFHRAIAKAMQSRVEQSLHTYMIHSINTYAGFQAYCRIIEERLIPWLVEQLSDLPRRLRMRFSKRMHFSQVLQSIRPGAGYIDLETRNEPQGGDDMTSRVSEESASSKLPAVTTPAPIRLTTASVELATGSLATPTTRPRGIGAMLRTKAARISITTEQTTTTSYPEGVIDEEMIDEGEEEAEEEEVQEAEAKPLEVGEEPQSRRVLSHQQLQQMHRSLFYIPTRKSARVGQ